MCLQKPKSKLHTFTSLGVCMGMNGLAGSCVPPVENVPKCSPVELLHRSYRPPLWISAA